MLLRTFASIGLICGAALGAGASDTKIVSGGLSREDWSFAAVEHSGELVAMFGVREAEAHVAVQAVIFLRDGVGNWILHGWDARSPEEAIVWLSEVYGIDATDVTSNLWHEFDEDWMYSIVDPHGPAGIVEGGLFTGDPLHILVTQSSDPVGLLEILEGQGYPAISQLGGSSSPSAIPPTPCDPSDIEIVTWLESFFEESILGPIDDVSVYLQESALSCAPCKRKRVIGPTTTTYQCGE